MLKSSLYLALTAQIITVVGLGIFTHSNSGRQSDAGQSDSGESRMPVDRV